MPLLHDSISATQPIPTPTRLFVEYVTTTIRASPTGATQKHIHPIPVGAIAAGVVGGAILAVLVTVAWVCWGKSIKRSDLKQKREADSLRKTRYNTNHNAIISKPRSYTYRPLRAPPNASEKKIKFVGHDEPWHLDAPSKSIFPGRHFTTQFMPAHLMRPPAPIPAPAKPRPLRSVKGSTHLATLAADRPTLSPPVSLSNQIPPRPPRSKQRITHKPSDVSSVSMYSTASGEEHQTRVPPNLILAALGNLGGGGDRNSGVSSRWSLISRWTQAVQGGGESNRQSQASGSQAADAASVDSSGMPIGVAY